jgi:hypothetical protein
MNNFTRVVNVVYTEPGIRQGFVFKELAVYLFVFGKFISFRIPFWIVRYDKKQAKEINEVITKIEQMESEDGEL